MTIRLIAQRISPPDEPQVLLVVPLAGNPDPEGEPI